METRGVRGLVFVDHHLILASFTNELFLLDTERGTVIGKWEYPELSFLHKIYYDGEHIVIPSTGNDSVARIHPGTMELVDIVTLTGSPKDTLHFNSMGWDGEGNEYHLYHTPGKIVRRDTGETVFEDLVGAHDLEFIDGLRVVVNDSSRRRTMLGDLRNKELTPIFTAEDGPSTTVSKWGWTRGAAYYPGMLFIGSAPANIHLLETTFFLEVGSMRLSDTAEESIFDICLDPRDWQEECE